MKIQQVKQVNLFFVLLFLSLGSYAQDRIEDKNAKGKEIYGLFCASCHLESGEGVEGVFPPLAGSNFLKKNQAESIKAIKFGLKGEIVVNGKIYNNYMPESGLTDEEITAVMNYINHSWGNENDVVSLKEVSNTKNK